MYIHIYIIVYYVICIYTYLLLQLSCGLVNLLQRKKLGIFAPVFHGRVLCT